MASANQAAKAEAKKVVKEVAKEIAKEAKNSAQRNQGPGKRWNNKQGRHMPKNKERRTKQTVTKEVTKKLKKEGLEGPRPRFSVRVSATIGKVGPNKAQGPELQIATFLHPGLMKEPNDGTNFGPLQAAAAQWGMWRIAHLTVRFTPLVGPSPVTGSVYRVSLNLTQSPGNSSWGGLGARRHMDIPVGRQVSWKLSKGELYGPRQTWWMTDTNEEGGQSCGAIIEVHGLGKTTSTYKDEAWNGDLFIVEVDGKWEFTNYSAKPALGMLDRKTEVLEAADKQPGLQVTDGVLEMVLPTQTELARFMGDRFERNAPSGTTIGETIWQVVDEGAGLASNLAPAPFGWLIKGAWWFVKKIAGRSANTGSEVYQVFASLADAQNGKPAMAETFPLRKAATTLTVTQVNAPNVGPSDSRPSYHAGVSPYPLVPSTVPPPAGSKFLVTALGMPIKISYDSARESVWKAYARVTGDDYLFSIKVGGRRTFVTSAYLLRDVLAFTVSDDNQVTGCYNPAWMRPTRMTLHHRNTDMVIGHVVAYKADNWGTSAGAFTCATWLVRVERTTEATEPVNFYNYAPGPYLSSGTSLNPPEYYTINKAGIPTMNRAGTTSHTQCRVHIPRIESQTLLLAYSVGVNAIGADGMADGQPFAGVNNDRVLDQSHSCDFGFWGSAMSPIAPLEDRVTVMMSVPTQQDKSTELVDDIMLAIQRRFNLHPISESESDPEDEGSQSGSEEEPCPEEPTPPQPTPRLKFAKEMMYEALRDSDWTHVDAEALLAAISSKN